MNHESYHLMDAAILTASIKNCESFMIALRTLSHGWYIMHSPSSQHDEHISIVTIFFGVHNAIRQCLEWCCKAHLGEQCYS